jgi:hypothetical protein
VDLGQASLGCGVRDVIRNESAVRGSSLFERAVSFNTTTACKAETGLLLRLHAHCRPVRRIPLRGCLAMIPKQKWFWAQPG